ncbi:hypothetical protein B296_00026993, partial [Ensete ventricosum]
MGVKQNDSRSTCRHAISSGVLLAVVVAFLRCKPSAEGDGRKMASHLSLALSHLLRSPFFLLLSLSLLTYLVLRGLRVTGNSRRAIVTASPPGTTGLPLIGETPAFLAANHSGRGVYDFVRARHLRSITELVGDQSLLCASHEQHKFIRRHISCLFKLDSMDSTIKKFDELVIHTLRGWEEKETVLVLRDAMKITFTAICKMLISTADEQELEILRNDVSQVSEAMLALPLKFPGTRFYRGLKAIHSELAFTNYLSPLGSEVLNLMPYATKKGWIVNVNARSVHYDPVVYDDPVKFNPGRFDVKPYSFLAFGIGGRTCVGMNLAKAMMLVFLHRIPTATARGNTLPRPLYLEWYAAEHDSLDAEPRSKPKEHPPLQSIP